MQSVYETVVDYPPVVQGGLGTLFTWFVTALGSALVYLVPENLSKKKEGLVLDFALGFSGGVMLAASYWSLLEPAFEASDSFVEPTIGFVFGCIIIYFGDIFLPEPSVTEIKTLENLNTKTQIVKGKNKGLRKRKMSIPKEGQIPVSADISSKYADSYRRILLLVLSLTLHNFPEGLAVGVAFGNPSGSFSEASVLALGIGLQNFPEGLAVSLPLRRLGISKHKSFMYGQLSGSVELVGGLIGAALVEEVTQILPYALGFAAGAMIFVVLDSIVPESHARGNRLCASWGAISGFVVMMVMDVSLG
eukprot:maker-scaffold_18-snap-gene-6.6-mRNA-1 protein AED:0.03 eAED:0.03 QI:20/1/1/1/1/1/3/86/304